MLGMYHCQQKLISILICPHSKIIINVQKPKVPITQSLKDIIMKSNPKQAIDSDRIQVLLKMSGNQTN